MSDVDREQQTEEATPQHKEKLRKEGKVVRSPDLSAAVVLIGTTAVFSAIGAGAATDFAAFSMRAFSLQDVGRPFEALSAVLPILMTTVAPPVLLAAVLAAAIGVVQTRGLFSLELLAFKPERLDPLSQLKNILPGKQSLAEIGKQLLKIAVLGFVVYRLVAQIIPEFAVLAASHPDIITATVAAAAGDVAIHGGIAFALIAAFDYWLAHRKFEAESKMTKQNIRDEHKEMEGRPEVKQRQRQRMREGMQRRAAGGLEKATVLITNPTHIAIALRYDAAHDAAPILLAKGTEEQCMKMRAEARTRGIPVVENRPLARALYAKAKIGRQIPPEHYRAVAEVIAHVLRLRGGFV